MKRPADESDQIFASAAELFGVLATPIRLRIISALCQGKRRDSTQIYYRIVNEQAASICRTVCTQMALGLEDRPAAVVAD